jgi:hypothetical protein
MIVNAKAQLGNRIRKFVPSWEEFINVSAVIDKNNGILTE